MGCGNIDNLPDFDCGSPIRQNWLEIGLVACGYELDGVFLSQYAYVYRVVMQRQYIFGYASFMSLN